MWRPRLVALDIDGTLLDHNGVLPEDVRAAVRRVVEAGVPVVLATGRSWHSTQPVVEELGLPPGQTVASNGAVRVSFPPLVIEHLVTFDATDIAARVAALHPEAALAVEVLGRGYMVTKEFPEGEISGEIVRVPLSELTANPVTRVVVRDPNASEQDFLRLAERVGMHGVAYFIGWTAWLDIAPEGVDKAHGVAAVCRGLGIDRADVLALGDGRNDIELLRWAGRGVALGDAPADVKAVADAVADRFEQGGTVTELDRWFG
jgi:hydroxymethylpyrimidine pyrophosphatase-like HAD family hydrolase